MGAARYGFAEMKEGRFLKTSKIRPHPGPLPLGEGDTSNSPGGNRSSLFVRALAKGQTV
jgi:hypothetical protein